MCVSCRQETGRTQGIECKKVAIVALSDRCACLCVCLCLLQARGRAQWAEVQAEGLQDRIRQALLEQQQQQQQQEQEQAAGSSSGGSMTHAELRRRRRREREWGAVRKGRRAEGWQWPGREEEMENAQPQEQVNDNKMKGWQSPAEREDGEGSGKLEVRMRLVARQGQVFLLQCTNAVNLMQLT